eukprot:gene28510-31667_t
MQISAQLNGICKLHVGGAYETLTVLGTGAMARAIGTLAKDSGAYEVVYGSRQDESGRQALAIELGAPVETVTYAVRASDGIVVFAVPAGACADMLPDIIAGGDLGKTMVLVELSNPDMGVLQRLDLSAYTIESEATKLQRLLDDHKAVAWHVVKAFNNIGAYEVLNGIKRGYVPTTKVASHPSLNDASPLIDASPF